MLDAAVSSDKADEVATTTTVSSSRDDDKDSGYVPVDRSNDSLLLPGRLVFPALTGRGPDVLDLEGMELWRHPDHERLGMINGNEIHKYLMDTGLITSCLTIHDLVAIRGSSVQRYRDRFGDKNVYGWRSAIQVRLKSESEVERSEIRVPFTKADRGREQVNILWGPVDIGFLMHEVVGMYPIPSRCRIISTRTISS